MKKISNKVVCMLLATTLMVGSTLWVGGCANGSSGGSIFPGTSSGNSANQNMKVKAALKWAAAEDKILQSYKGDSMSDFKARFMDTLTEEQRAYLEGAE